MVSVRIVKIIIELHLTKRHVGQMNVLAYRNFYQMEHVSNAKNTQEKLTREHVPKISVPRSNF